MKSAKPAALTTVPVGLFGVQTSTSRVREVMAAAIAGKSCSDAEVRGTVTLVAPATATSDG